MNERNFQAVCKPALSRGREYSTWTTSCWLTTKKPNMTIIIKMHSLDIQTVQWYFERLLPCGSLVYLWISSDVDSNATHPGSVQAGVIRRATNIRILNSISWLHGSRFTTACGNFAPSNGTRWRNMAGSTRCGGRDWKRPCWLVIENSGFCIPRRVVVCGWTGWARKLDEHPWNLVINEEKELE